MTFWVTFFKNKPKIKNMAKIQKSVRWIPWVEKAMKKLAEDYNKEFSWIANYLVETKLNDLGIYRKDFEPGLNYSYNTENVDIILSKGAEDHAAAV